MKIRIGDILIARNKREIIRLPIWMIFIFSYLMNPVFTVLRYRYTKAIYYIAMLLYLIFNMNVIMSLFHFNKKEKNILIVLSVWLAVFLFTPILHGTYDFSYYSILRTITGRLLAHLVILVVLVKRKTGDLFKDFCDSYIAVETFYCVVTVIILMFPAYRAWIQSNVFMNAIPGSAAADNIAYLMSLPLSYTRIGYDGFAMYGTGLKVSIAFVLSIYMLYRSKFSFRYLITTGMLFVGSIFYTRTGLLVDILVIIMFVLLQTNKNALVHYLKIIFPIMFLAVVVLYSFRRILPQESLSWAKGLFQPDETANIMFKIGNGGFLATHIFFPSASVLIAGAGYFQKYINLIYQQTDSGFMCMVIYAGLPMTLMVYGIMVSMLNRVKKKKGVEKCLFYGMLMLLFVFEFKGESLIYTLPFFIIFMMVVSYQERIEVSDCRTCNYSFNVCI